MARVEVSSVVPHPREEVFAWHARPGAIARLTPPWTGASVLDAHVPAPGTRVVARMKGLTIASTHTAVEPPWRFADEGTAGPMRFTHEHVFDDVHGATRVTDRVTFSPSLPTAKRLLERSLAWRQSRLAMDLARHAQHRARPRLRVAMTGATGFLGGQLSAFLSTGGHEVVGLARSGPGPRWDPATGALHDAGRLDAVVHLAGEPIAQGRWTAAKLRRIRESRVDATRRLCEALASMDAPPATLVCASAIGFYGDRGEETLDESSPPGEGFMAEVVRDWEAACAPAREAGIRVANLRTGIVLAADGSALAKFLTPFRFGVGGPLGNGRQWMSWISREDWVGAAHHVLVTGVEGPVDLTAPHAVRNREFARTLGRVLHRPSLLPVPAPALRLAVGGVASEVLGSARVLPRRLEASGFAFLHADLEEALRWELGLPAAPREA